MDRPSGNQEVIVFFRGPDIDVLCRWKMLAACLRGEQVAAHRFAVHALFQTQVDSAVFFGVEQVIAFILRVMHPEFFLDVFGEGMDLKRQIPAIPSVEKIEANGKFRAKAAMDGVAEQFTRMTENEIDRGALDPAVAETENQAVFFRDAIEAPREILSFAVQIANFLHPLTAPRPGIKKGNYSKRAARCGVEAGQKHLPCHHLRSVAFVCIEVEIETLEQLLFKAVGGAPVDEECTLVFQRGRISEVIGAQVPDFAAPLALLNFPASHVRVNQNAIPGCEQSGASA